MKKADVSIYLDKNRPKQNGLCSVKIRVTHNRKRKYFRTGFDLSKNEFEQIFFGKRKTFSQKSIKIQIEHFERKAINIINNLNVFSFNSFEDAYLNQKNTTNSVSFAFDKYIDDLKLENRLGTASSYECAKQSIDVFKKGLTFADITPLFLKKYESWMIENGKSISTVGIYLRSLRAVYNLQNIDKSIYPFGSGKNKYSIPRTLNTKKALTNQEVALIFNYQTEELSVKDMAKDYWIFLFLCNGMNVKDFCLLKWENINGDMLKYRREKSIRTQRTSKLINVSLKEESKAIIRKWGQPSINESAFVFPVLKEDMTPEQKRAKYKQLTKTINKYIKQISAEVGIEKKVTTYYARHSFATILKRNGSNVELISELLGHSDINVTESYLDSFENEQIQKQTESLTIGFNKAN